MIDTDKYKGHTPGPWWTENGFIMGNHPDDSVLVSETLEILEGNEADAQLATDAPLLLEHVKRLTKTLELIAKEMPYDYWLHTLIDDVIGYEKWQAKEMIE